MFARIVHSDWSKHPGGRWCASARRTTQGWRAEGPRPVGDVADFVDDLLAEAAGTPTLAAFDFPVGLPEAYGATTGLSGFREALDAFGGSGWMNWFDPAATPAEIGPRRPFYPAKPGASAIRHLLDGLGASSVDGLLRGCERGGTELRAAGCMFWLVGAKTVGKAAIHGWREAIRPALARGAALWPFDGDLETLAARGGLVLAESYPGDATRQLGLVVGSKSSTAVLATLAPAICTAADAQRIDLAPELRDAIGSGFAGFRPHVGDAFDAVVGLLAAIAVANGEIADGAPRGGVVQCWEGWILGRKQPDPVAAVGVSESGA